MENFIIWDLHSLPEFKSIPSDEFEQVLAEYRNETFLSRHRWLEIASKLLFLVLGNFLYLFLRPGGTTSILWWLITVLLFSLVGSFVQDQITAHRTRKGLSEFIQQRKMKEALKLTESQEALYEHLRQIRVNMAVPRGLPSSTICQDTVLEALARSSPTTVASLWQLPGLTDEFVRNYGKIFVDEISRYEEIHRSL